MAFLELHSTGDFKYLQAPQLAKEHGVRHLFTTRHGGVSERQYSSLNFGFSLGDKKERVERNYEILFSEMGGTRESTVCAKQVHENGVLTVTRTHGGAGILFPQDYKADALITSTPGLTLIGYYADCCVALLYDPVNCACGVCHSGWRGAVLGILEMTIDAMCRQFGSEMQNLIIAFSPSIEACCFETDSDVHNAFFSRYDEEFLPFSEERGEKYHIDVPGFIAARATAMGILPWHITHAGLCTACHSDDFYSHRKTKGKRGVSCAAIRIV